MIRNGHKQALFPYKQTIPLRWRLPLPWPEFNREARRYARQLRDRIPPRSLGEVNE